MGPAGQGDSTVISDDAGGERNQNRSRGRVVDAENAGKVPAILVEHDLGISAPLLVATRAVNGPLVNSGHFRRAVNKATSVR
jgi:hypothetical protein